MTSWLPQPDQAIRPRYLALANAIAEDIEAGKLPFGARLPTHRQLAHRLGISIHTVSNAYGELERRGHVVGHVGRGTYVASSFRPDVDETGFILARRESQLVDMSILRPAIGPIHTERIREALSRMAGDQEFSSLLACRPIPGLDHHRVAGATWLNTYGHAVRPEQVMLVNGCAHGLLVALATVTKPGDIVATEALTDHGLIALASVLRFRLQGIEYDQHGLVPDAFERACSANDVKVLVVTPNYSNPTGTILPEERRRQIAEIAKRHDVTIIEDDVFLPLSPRPIPPISVFDRERAIYLTSLTKTLISGLRVGYLVAPEAMMPRLETRLRASSWMATPLVAEIAARWIEDGTAKELVDWQRSELKERLDILNRHLAGHRYQAQPSTPHVFLDLPSSWRPANFATHARFERVAVTPAEPFVVGDFPEPQAIRITLGAAVSRRQLDVGLKHLVALLSQEPEPTYISL